MKNQLVKVKDQAIQNFTYMVFFSGLFLSIGWGIPNMYYRFFDKTEYYKIESLTFDNNSKFKECSSITYLIERVSLVNSEILRDREISLILQNETRQEIWRDHVIDQIDIGEAKIRGEINPPCGELKQGSYFLNIVITYKVKGYERVYNFKSDKFEIVE